MISLISPITPVKYCSDCGTPLWFVSHGNVKYCTPCREEARLMKYRRYDNKRSKVRQIGTTTLGQHRDQDEKKELKIIRREKKRTFKVGTIYKEEKNSWIDYEGRVEYTDPPPLGLQITHKYATFDNYVRTSVNYWMTSQGSCPECESGRHLKDLSRCEVACECGLLLNGAPHPQFNYPDNTDNLPFCPMAHEMVNKKPPKNPSIKTVELKPPKLVEENFLDLSRFVLQIEVSKTETWRGNMTNYFTEHVERERRKGRSLDHITTTQSKTIDYDSREARIERLRKMGRLVQYEDDG